MKKHELKKWRENYTVWDAPCLGEGLHLNVHFDEKDDVKRLGARWNPDPSGKGGHWWMPVNKLEQDCPFEDEEFWGPGGSGTVQHWLNNHKMIAGQYQPEKQSCKAYIASQPGLVTEQYEVTSQDADASMTFTVYPNLDVAIVGNTSSSGAYQTMASARTVWDDMMRIGWRKIISTDSEVCA